MGLGNGWRYWEGGGIGRGGIEGDDCNLPFFSASRNSYTSESAPLGGSVSLNCYTLNMTATTIKYYFNGTEISDSNLTTVSNVKFSIQFLEYNTFVYPTGHQPHNTL